MQRTLYIETVGCQMNMLDSELVVASLRRQGYRLVASPAQADTVLFNTCSVRQHAEDKIYSALGRLKQAKNHHPEKIIGVLGCMAQKDQKLIFERAPYVDLVVGPGQIHRMAELLDQVARDGGQRLEVSLDRRGGSRAEIEHSFESYDPLRDEQMRPSRYQAFVRVMIGCDKFCTYCIVPSVRGPEQSRPPAQIEAEVRQLAAEGCREITLLGQTVNSYQHAAGERTTRLADLIDRLHPIAGIERIKFVTNYPPDMTDDLIAAVRDLPKCSHYLHVPAQSGSNDVLRRMKRGYTVESYREMLARIRAMLPSAAITSDWIVGFPGETEADFQATAALLVEGRFKNSFIFKYSPRPGTKAFQRFADDVPEAVKRSRNQELLALQTSISEQDNQAFLGRTVEVLVEGPSKSSLKQQAATNQAATDQAATDQAGDGPAGDLLQLTGRTSCDRIAVFEGHRRLIGQFVQLRVYDANAFTLFAGVVTSQVGPEVYTLV